MARMPGALLALVSLLLVAASGCMDSSPREHPVVDVQEPDAEGIHATLHPLGVYTVEPSIGVTSDGSLFVIANEEVLRSQDDGASWQQVHTYEIANSGAVDEGSDLGIPPSLDPWIWVDPITDRVYADHLTLACTSIAWSDDVGGSWTPYSPAACGSPLTDFQKLVTGPPGPVANPQAGVLHPTVAYLCYNKPVFDLTGMVPVGSYGLACAASYDGGLVWQNEALLTRTTIVAGTTVQEGCGGGAWIPAVAPDGTVVVRSQPDCMFRSRDSGATWQPIGTGPEMQGTIFSFDDAGTLYALSAYWEPPLRVSVSRDQGETWEEPYAVQPDGVRGPVFSTIVAGAAGKLFIPFWGTDEDVETGFEASDEARYHAWLVTVEGAGSASPEVLAYQATPDEAPMHIGPATRGDSALFLGDFVTAAIGPDGTPYVVFPDSCNEGCEGNPEATVEDLKQLGTVVALRGWPMR